MESQRQYWLFQYVGGERELKSIETAQKGEVVPWKMSRYGARIQAGDIVFFWRAGPQSGLRGWGTVIDEDEPPMMGKGQKRVSVRTEVNFGDPLPRDEVRSVPEISDLAVIMQGRQGTNFPVSTIQAHGLTRFIRSKGFDVPPIDIQEVKTAFMRRVEREKEKLDSLLKQLPTSEALDIREGIESLETALTQFDSADDLERIYNDLNALSNAVQSQSAQLERLEKGAKYDEAAFHRDTYLNVQQTAQQMQSDISQLRNVHLDLDQETPAEEIDVDTEFEEAGKPETSTYEAGEQIEVPEDPMIWPWAARDRIGIGEAVNNLSRYIAHQDLVPPRAIGIFGDWGSGKTFFMKAMQSQIALMAWQSRDAVENNLATVFCSRIVQIDFNAWHYVESNLWASLAGHIFEELHGALKREYSDKDDPVDVDLLFTTLATYREALQERDQQQRKVAELKEAREGISNDLIGSENLLATIRNQVLASAHELLAAELKSLTENQKSQIKQWIGRESLEELAEASEDLNRIVEESHGFSKQLSAEIGTWGVRNYLLAFLAGAVVLIGLPAAVALLNGWLVEQWAWLNDNENFFKVGSLIGGYAATAAGMISWLAARGRQVLDLAKKVNGFVVTSRRKAQAEKTAELLDCEQAIASARRELQEADDRLEKHRDVLVDIETQLREDNPGIQLKNFLENRVRSQTYERHLGLVSLVRKDFEMLSELMEEFWTNRDDASPYALVRQVNEKGELEEHRVPFIERIVLYIDDLDRCPPDKVVDVLQAVHLLLGFKLFVVVVGVDVRWIGRSLLKHYPDLIVGTVTKGHDRLNWRRASSDDYLEKIFQIPFRLPPMNDAARQGFVQGLLEERFLVGWREEDAASSLYPRLDLTPSELSLYPEETNCIDQLHSCLGRSPRRVKRFVDIYRLMRSGMEAGDVESVIRAKNYRQILSLFALLTGSTTAGPRIIEQLYGDLALEPNALINSNFQEWIDNKFAMNHFFEDDEMDSARSVLMYLDSLEPREQVIDGLVEWMPEVARYSFREVRLHYSISIG